MAEIVGKISYSYNFSASNTDFSSNQLSKFSPGVIKMPAFSNLRPSTTVRSPAGDGLFSRSLVFGGQNRGVHTPVTAAFHTKMSIGIGKSLKWWEKGLKPNMKEVRSADDLVHSLLSAGDKLVIVDFFSPGCGGCRALHPKICQIADMNPEVQFVQVNYEEHKSMCYSLNVHVLPFFRFYRGPHGRLCSFSCTNATIKKFKDALAKHRPDRCGLGPPKGLEEKQLLALANNRDLTFVYPPNPQHMEPEPSHPLPLPLPLPLPRALEFQR